MYTNPKVYGHETLVQNKEGKLHWARKTLNDRIRVRPVSYWTAYEGFGIEISEEKLKEDYKPAEPYSGPCTCETCCMEEMKS